MNRREWSHLLALFAVALVIRGLLFNWVGIWGDAGFYIYDARLINSGLTPYIDFIGRSPSFNYSYAAFASVFGNSMTTLRAFIALPWLLVGPVVYWIAREIHSHRAGLAAFAVMELSPFMLVYGYWANTQSLAALAGISGIAVLVWRRNSWTYSLSGALFGVAFLSRRSMITVMGAIALWMGYLTLREDRSDVLQALRTRTAYGLEFLAGFTVALFAMYGWMATWDIGTTIALAETHAWGLVSSSGRGGFPLLTEHATPSVTNELDDGRIPIFNDVCQMCGAWTARTFAKTTLVTTPVIGPLLYYFRDWSDRWFTDRTRDYTFGILLILAGYGAVTATLAGFYTRPMAVLSLVLFGVVAFKTPSISREILYHRHMVLIGLCCAGLTAGYLYRNRILHTYYFADFFPFLSVLVGVVAVAAWEVME